MCCVRVLSSIWLFATPGPIRLLCPWNFPGKNTGVVAISYFRWSFWSRDQTWVSCIGRWILYHWATWEAHVCINIQYLFFFFWFTSLCITGCMLIHLTRTDSNSFLLCCIIFHCIYVPKLFDPLIYQWTSRLFHVLAIVNSASMNTGDYVSFSVMVFSVYMPSSRVAGSYGSFIPSFLRNLYTHLYSGCISLHSHQRCKRVPFPAPSIYCL